MVRPREADCYDEQLRREAAIAGRCSARGNALLDVIVQRLLLQTFTRTFVMAGLAFCQDRILLLQAVNVFLKNWKPFRNSILQWQETVAVWLVTKFLAGKQCNS